MYCAICNVFNHFRSDVAVSAYKNECISVSMNRIAFPATLPCFSQHYYTRSTADLESKFSSLAIRSPGQVNKL